ncbi:MAG: hypothetical protein JNM27_11185 [Leptospirales bacterium]|nr:hypothetical protein [Leptospirales bacterium]
MTATNFLTEPVVCDMGVFAKEERANHIATAARLFSHCISLREVKEGFEIEFDPSIEESEIKTWSQNESRCCKFADYRLTREGGSRKLLVRTSDDGRPYLRQAYQWMLGGKMVSPPSIKATKVKFGGAIAAILCAACLLPLAGGFLVSRGIVGSFWNPGELVWAGIGLTLVGIWSGISYLRKRKKVSDACAC